MNSSKRQWWTRIVVWNSYPSPCLLFRAGRQNSTCSERIWPIRSTPSISWTTRSWLYPNKTTTSGWTAKRLLIISNKNYLCLKISIKSLSLRPTPNSKSWRGNLKMRMILCSIEIYSWAKKTICWRNKSILLISWKELSKIECSSSIPICRTRGLKANKRSKRGGTRSKSWINFW